MRWKNGTYTWLALGSVPSTMADTSGVVAAICDEFDENLPGLKHDPYRLVGDRIRNAGNRSKMATVGTPRRTDKGGLQARYNLMRSYSPEMRCPECGEYQQFELEHIGWPSGMTATEVLEQVAGWAACPGCGSQLGDDKHREMALSARFKCLNPERPMSRRSARIPGWCTLQTNWSRAAYEWLSVQDDPIAQIGFWNSVAAIARDVGSDTSSKIETRYANRKAGHMRGHAPKGSQLLTFGCDVGVRTLWWWCWAWGSQGRVAMVDAGGLPYGDEASRTIEAARDELYEITKKLSGSTGLPFRGGIIDSGDQATTVYDLCVSWPGGGWLPAHGSTKTPNLWRLDKVDPLRKHRGRWGNLQLIGHHTHRLQDRLEHALTRDYSKPQGCALVSDTTDTELLHLRSCVRVEHLRTTTWDKAYKGAPDHMRDAACLAMLAGIVGENDRLEDVAEVEKPAPKPAPRPAKAARQVSDRL
jgi:phage terminase large subunit GpA-like protein